jgi:hypothetical protein
MASSFVGTGVDTSGKVIADPLAQNPILARPQHA